MQDLAVALGGGGGNENVTVGVLSTKEVAACGGAVAGPCSDLAAAGVAGMQWGAVLCDGWLVMHGWATVFWISDRV